MKPMHLAVVCAVIAVATVLFLMLSESGDDRHRDRGGADRAAGRSTTGDQEGTDEADAREDAGGAGALSFQLKIVLPDGSAAAGAELELSGRAPHRDVATTEGKVEISESAGPPSRSSIFSSSAACVEDRSAGSFSVIHPTSCAAPKGTPSSAGSGSWMCLYTVSTGGRPRNGGRPDSISWSTTPRE